MLDLTDFLTHATDLTSGVFSAQVESVNTDGTIDISFRAGQVFGVEVLSSYTPGTGDVVQVARKGSGRYLVLGSVRRSNLGSLHISSSLAMPWTVDPVPRVADPDDNPTGLADPFIVSATSTGSYRQSDGWNGQSSDVRQSAYSTSYGWYTGCWFYGTKAQALRDQTVTRLRIHLKRAPGSSTGSAGAEPLYVYPHIHTSRPGSAPSLKSSAGGVRAPYRIAGVAIGDSATFDLPRQWGQALADGVIKGFAIRRNNRGDYVILYSKSEYTNSGRLTLDWN